MRVLSPSPVPDKNPAPMGPEILSSTEAGVWRKAPKGFPDSSSVLDKFQSAKKEFEIVCLKVLKLCLSVCGCKTATKKRLVKSF